MNEERKALILLMRNCNVHHTPNGPEESGTVPNLCLLKVSHNNLGFVQEWMNSVWLVASAPGPLLFLVL